MNERQGTRLLVWPEHEGLRLDQFLAAATSLSRRAARVVISDGVVARNCQPTRVQSRIVEWGDVVDILRPADELEVPASPALPDLPILHHDRWLLAVNKPAGMLCQPSSKSENELTLDQLAVFRVALENGSRPYLRMVHRLDRLTSGVTLFARNPQTHGPLVKSWSSGKVERRYLAVVEGAPSFQDELIDEPIGRDPGHDWRFRVADTGRPAQTEVRVAAHLDEDLAVVECRLVTGRTHQVRVHLAHRGLPVLGDRLYGSQRAGLVDRPLLHASKLSLPHPNDGKRLRFEAPIPADMAPFLTSNHQF